MKEYKVIISLESNNLGDTHSPVIRTLVLDKDSIWSNDVNIQETIESMIATFEDSDNPSK